MYLQKRIQMPFGKRCSGKIKSVRDEKKSWLLENTYFQVPMYYFHPSPINSSFIHFSLKKILVKVNLNLRFYCSHPDTCRPLINLKRERINRSSAQEKKKIIYTRTLTPKLKSTSKKKKKKKYFSAWISPLPFPSLDGTLDVEVLLSSHLL